RSALEPRRRLAVPAWRALLQLSGIAAVQDEVRSTLGAALPRVSRRARPAARAGRGLDPDLARAARRPHPLTAMPIVRRALHPAGRLTAAAFAAVAVLAPATLRSQLPSPADTSIRGLPLTEVPARRPGDALAVFLTGDGGFAELDRQIAH